MYSAVLPSRLIGFGYRFLGPFLLDWYNLLDRRTKHLAIDRVYAFGREGWNIAPLFNSIEALRPDASRRYVYLQTSRALLTHISLSEPALSEVGFAAGFNGTVRQFFESRLGVPAELFSVSACADQSISLPRDRAYVAHLFEQGRADAIMMADRTREAYGRYLDRIGLVAGKRCIVTDLGFRGTSQALIAQLYQRDLLGCYAIFDPAGVPLPLSLPQDSAMGLFSQDRSFGSGYAPIDGSLLLESILTAPVGQTIGMQDGDRGDPFIYREGGTAQTNYGTIAECIQGAYKFVHDNINLIGGDELFIDDFEAFFESYRGAIIDNIDLLRPIFGIDDSYFGADMISAECKL
jgi:hypothetical protein